MEEMAKKCINPTTEEEGKTQGAEAGAGDNDGGSSLFRG